jgi:prepilin-type N-terminal cleavage/methylation domain-containing protein
VIASLGGRGDRGYSLAEMLVTVIVFAIVTGAITTVVISSLGHQRELSDRGEALAQMRTTLERIDRDVRSANPLCAASYTRLQLEEDAPAPGRIIEYSVSGNRLIATEYGLAGATGSCTPTAGATRGPTVLQGNLVNTSRVFSLPSADYYLCDADPNPTDPASVPIGQITSLAIHLSVQPSSLDEPVSLSDCGTQLRNVS